MPSNPQLYVILRLGRNYIIGGRILEEKIIKEIPDTQFLVYLEDDGSFISNNGLISPGCTIEIEFIHDFMTYRSMFVFSNTKLHKSIILHVPGIPLRSKGWSKKAARKMLLGQKLVDSWYNIFVDQFSQYLYTPWYDTEKEKFKPIKIVVKNNCLYGELLFKDILSTKSEWEDELCKKVHEECITYLKEKHPAALEYLEKNGGTKFNEEFKNEIIIE